MTTSIHDRRTSSRAADPAPRAGTGRAPAVPVRRPWNLPWVLVGVVMILASGLAFAAWAGSAGHVTPALALAHDVSAGHEITAADLTTVEVGRAASPSSIAPGDKARVIGRAALVDLSAGTLLTADVLGGNATVAPGHALVAVRVDDVAGPLPVLRPGNTVMVVGTADPASAGDGRFPAVWPATVFSVSRVIDQGGIEVAVVSLEVDALNAPAIASASASDRIRLALVGTPDDIPPELLFGDLLEPVGGEPAPGAPS